MKHSLLSLTLFTLFSVKLFAQDEFERIEVLDKPQYSLTKRFALDAELSFLPLDAYYKPVLMDIAANYQFTDWIAVEGRIGFPILKHDTGLKDQVETFAEGKLNNGQQVSLTKNLEMNDLRYRVSTTGFLNLLYSKSNWFNKSVVYHFWQVGAGMSYFDFDKKHQPAIDGVMRVRFFIDNRFMINLRAAYSFGLNADVPRNIITLGLGGGFAF